MKKKTRISILLISIILVTLILNINPVFAYTYKSVDNYKSEIKDLTLFIDDSKLTYDNMQFNSNTGNFKRWGEETVNTLGSSVTSPGQVYYQGTFSQNTGYAGVKLEGEEFSMRFPGAAVLADGSRKDVLYTFNNIYYAMKKTCNSIYQPIIIAWDHSGLWICSDYQYATGGNTCGWWFNLNIKIVEPNTTQVIDQSNSYIYRIRDIDTPDMIHKSYNTNSTGWTTNGTAPYYWQEFARILSGVSGPIYCGEDIYHNDNTYWGSEYDNQTDKSAVYFKASPDITLQMGMEGAGLLLNISMQYNITATAGEGGSITMPGVNSLGWHMSREYKAMPNPGYKLKSLKVDGNIVDGDTYYFNNIESNHTISAEFEKIDYNINAKVVGGEGTISNPGNTTVTYGENKEYTMTPAEGWQIKEVKVDGIVNEDAKSSKKYTFSNVTEDHEITVEYEKIKHNINAKITGNYPNGGLISNLGDSTVEHGENKSYTITPNEGFYISKLVVDGNSIPINNSYDFINVITDHTIEVQFLPYQAAEVRYIDISNNNILENKELFGESNTEIDYSTTQTIKKYTNKGYALEEDEFPTDAKFDDNPDNNQLYLVKLDPIIEPITYKTPKPITEQMNPDGTKYPEGLDKNDLSKEIKRTIQYKFSDGSKAAEDVIQNTLWTRTATVNHVTSEVVYQNWENNNPTFPSLDSPEIENYRVDISSVPALTTTKDTKDSTIVVTYSPILGSVDVVYKDVNGTILEGPTVIKKDVIIGTPYVTSPKIFNEYTFKEMGHDSAPASGNVVEGNQHIVYLYEKNGSAKVIYKDTKGNILEESIVIDNVSPGTEYTTTQKTFNGYHFKEMDPSSDPTSGTIESGKTLNIIYIYEKNNGYLTISKLSNRPDVLDYYPITGAEFTLYKDDKIAKDWNDRDAILTIAQNGKSNKIRLDAGTYKIVETRVPNGYKKIEEFITIENGEEKVFEITNILNPGKGKVNKTY